MVAGPQGGGMKGLLKLSERIWPRRKEKEAEDTGCMGQAWMENMASWWLAFAGSLARPVRGWQEESRWRDEPHRPLPLGALGLPSGTC